ncbi:TetR/AcrR family transcriptional regulator [Plantactinospora endophytica]|uniref:TetR family transcriptional regulator n=1 Tax=Plantactinospora endophytica TaxID=673535 RepID=A0ABQ4DVG3_9ACTN|nr:TetR/AcrR family transcriptional regulator [Plantactinospora endophytica]GIG86436.1 TetR family transcriptional regulator [Plantactinospora endophytica]
MSGTRATGRRPRAARAPAERPAQILDAAARVLLRDGVDATIDGIAAEAGLGKGTVYEYFGSKAQVFTALRNRCNEQILAAGATAVSTAPDAPALDRVRRFVAGMFEFGVANAALVALLFHEAGIEEPDELGPIRASLLDLVESGVRAGELAVEDPAFTVEFLLHGLHGVMETALAAGTAAGPLLDRLDGVLVALLDPVHPVA